MLVDVLIIALLISAVYRGWHSGFVRQFCATAGFFGGLFLGGWLLPHAINLAQSSQSRALVTIGTVLGCALVGLTLGEYLGLRLKRHLVVIKGINRLDSGLGGALGIVSMLVSVWLVASIVASLPFDQFGGSLRGSRIIANINHLLPSAPTVISGLGHLIDPNGFPDVFIGNEPIPRGNISLPALGDLATAVNNDKNSVVRIKGQGCGGVVAGSGFVVASDLVATNAHVVAGIHTPFVQDANGSHAASVVSFDSDLDFALLRVNNLAGHALPVSTQRVAQGSPAAVLGYPGGGSFTADPAAVIDQISASGHNIYGSGHTLRDVYEVRADIVPGNSGGPLVAKDGRVIGVVFAQSTTYKHIGYALLTSQLTTEIQQASNRHQSVGTGHCAE